MDRLSNNNSQRRTKTRVSQKRLRETFELFERDLEKKYGEKIRLFTTGPGLPNVIYTESNDLVRGGNHTLWSWIFKQLFNSKGERQ